jgi:hypothetical protein
VTRRRTQRCAAFAVALALATVHAPAAAAKTPLLADDMTVSGRLGLANADASLLKGRLALDSAASNPAIAEKLRTTPEELDAALTQAAAKSLRNHGYFGEGVRLRLALDDLQLVDGETGVTATARVTVTADGEEALAACARRPSTASFTALDWERRSSGLRTFSLVMGTLIAATSPLNTPTTSMYLSGQFSVADQNDAAFNGQRSLTTGQGVAQAPGKGAAERHAAISAIRLALADYVASLAAAEACKTPAAPVQTAETAHAETSVADPSAANTQAVAAPSPTP